MADLHAVPSLPDFGQVLFSTHRDPEHAFQYRIHIDRADPKAYITSDLLMKAMEGEIPCIEVDGEQLDRIVVADDYGQRFIYVLGNYEPLYDAFEMEWPD